MVTAFGDLRSLAESDAGCRCWWEVPIRQVHNKPPIKRTSLIGIAGDDLMGAPSIELSGVASMSEVMVGYSDKPEGILLSMASSHGLITGALGTGKTMTMQMLTEGFSRHGVPVFAPDIRGDLSGLSKTGKPRPFLVDRAQSMGFDYQPDASPTIFWDLFGEQGHPLRATVSEMGTALLARLLNLNDVQEGVLNIAFRIADDNGFALLDFNDLRAIIEAVTPFGTKREAEQGTGNAQLDKIKRSVAGYGNVTKQSAGAIQRALLILENQGGAKFFGEPTPEIKDFMRIDGDGRGYISILAAHELMRSPRLYSTFLFWLLTELVEGLPEVGDHDKPKLVFFIDEAHLLFDDAPKALLDRIEQVLRLARSKGVGVFLVTQNHLDVPAKVLSQLGNRVQHAVRDQRWAATVAGSVRANPKLNTGHVLMELGKGEALVSFLQANGVPSMVERCIVRPPFSRIGSITSDERAAIMANSPVKGKYDTAIDSEAAYEKLSRRLAAETGCVEARGADPVTDWVGAFLQSAGEGGTPPTTINNVEVNRIDQQSGRLTVCQRCGDSFPAKCAIRKKLRTSTSVSGIAFTSRPMLDWAANSIWKGRPVGIRNHYAVRTVCKKCADGIEKTRKWQNASIVILGVSTVLVFLFALSVAK